MTGLDSRFSKAVQDLARPAAAPKQAMLPAAPAPRRIPMEVGVGVSSSTPTAGGYSGIASPLTERTAPNGEPLRETSIRRIYDVTGALYLDDRVIDRWFAEDANGRPVELVFTNPGTPPAP